MHRITLTPLADLGGGTLAAFGQNGTKAVAVGDFFHHGEGCNVVTKRQIDAIHVGGADESVGVGFHGKRQGKAQRYRVEPPLVAQIVKAHNHAGIAGTNVGSERATDFLVHSAGPRVEVGISGVVVDFHTIVGAARAA